jgi:hypothetical protein
MSKDLNRRAILAGAAAVPLAPAVARASGDAELRRLWSEYLKHAAAYAVARKRYEPARAAFDAEFPPCPDDVLPGTHWRAHDRLWQKHGLDPLDDASNAADTAVRETIAIILHTEAAGLFGIGVKLAALPHDYDPQDWVEVAAAVRLDIDRLIGSGFAELAVSSAEESVS